MPHSRRLSLAALALLVAPLVACATAAPGGPAASTASFDARRADRVCRVAEHPAVLPGAAELVDEAAFRAALRQAWKSAGSPPGHVLFSLRYDRGGLNVRRAVVEHTVTEALADSLQRILFAHRRQAAAAPWEWGVRLKVELGEEPAMSVARHEVCRPTPRERGDRLALGSAFTDIREDHFPTPGSSTVLNTSVVWVRVRLDAAGAVTDARVERGMLRGPWETRLLGYVRTIAFLPALEDGHPVPGETTIPVRLAR